MSALRELTEDECYLAALLDDPSGIELAEFTFIDEEKKTGCYRLWDFQWPLYRNESTFQIDHMGRSLGKSQGILMRACAFVFSYPGAEMLITAPELNHLKPITDKVEHQLRSVKLLREMLPRTQGRGINHQPQFQVQFINNARIFSRLPNRDGRGVKGSHPLVIEMDEGQDYPEPGWIELIETMKAGVEGAQWRVHGVSRGTRDRFYKYTMGEDPDLPFYVHRYMAMHRPFWSDEERRSKLAIYGGSSANVDYRRNIYGEHGDVSNPLFVLARLMQCVRIAETPWAEEYNRDIYTAIKINDEMFKSSGQPIEAFIDIPGTHLDEQYTSFYGGMDIGFTRDPTEILIFGEYAKDKNTFALRLLLRLQLMRISAADQAAAVRHIFDLYGKRLQTFTLDRTGVGLPVDQELNPERVGTFEGNRLTPKHISDRIVGYGFAEKIPVDFEDRDLTGKETPEDAVLKKNVIEYAADEMRKVVDQGRVELPYDKELLSEWQGQAIEYVRDEGSASGIKKNYKGSLHTLDAAFMMIAGRNLRGIRETLAEKPVFKPVNYLFG